MSTFPLAFREILRLEGGFVVDSGGPTNYGITQSTYDYWRSRKGLDPRPVKDITLKEVEDIYREDYWDPVAAEWDENGRPGIALYLFDAAVQHGIGRVRHWEERVGDVLFLHPLLGLAYLHRLRTEFYARLDEFATNGRGWMRRVAYIYSRAVELEHPMGLIRIRRVFVDGDELDYPPRVRWVGNKLYVRRA